MESSDVMTVREMIDAAFGESDNTCPVNLNMVGSILYIIARRMELLKRHFKVEMREKLAGKAIVPKSTFVVTEIKIHTKGKKKKSRRASKSSRSTGRRTHSRQLFSDDNSSDVLSDDERFTKESATHKRLGDKYSQSRQPAKIHRSARSKTVKYYDDESPPERRKAEKYSDRASPSVRHRATAGKTTRAGQRRAENDSEDGFSIPQRKSGKYLYETSTSAGRLKGRKYSDDDDISPTNRRGARKSPHHTANRRKAGKRSPSERSGVGDDDSPSDEPSSERAVGRKSRKGKSGAEGRPTGHAPRFHEKESQERRGKDVRRQASDDDLEEQHEKILVVTSTPSGRQIRRPNDTMNPVVTQEQYDNLLTKTRILQKKFGIKTKWDNLGETTSITDPKAALNMSVRLDRAENRLARILEIVTQLASEVPEIDIEAVFNETSLSRNVRQSTNIRVTSPESSVIQETSEVILHRQAGTKSFHTPEEFTYALAPEAPGSQSATSQNNVTRRDFNEELQMLQSDLYRDINRAIADTRAEQTKKIVGVTEIRVNKIYKHFQQLAELSYAVEKYGKAVTAMDQYIATQMANFQDTLLLMQAELEMALDKLSDSLTSPKEDAAAVAQITDSFSELKSDLVGTETVQTELKHDIENYCRNLEAIQKRIDELQNRKCTREQMFEALEDKLSLKDINGILTHDQFAAVMTTNTEAFQKIQMKIFTKECDWQQVIDQFYTKCAACADSTQLDQLNKSLQQYLTRMDTDLNQMFAIVLAAKIFPTDKKIQRDDNCLSCGVPAEAKKDEISLKIWHEIISTTDPTAVLERMKFKYEDKARCIPGRPVPHPLEQNSFICQHDCGEIIETMEVLELLIKKVGPDSQSSREATSEKLQDQDR